jgi:predicted Zn-dependent protease
MSLDPERALELLDLAVTEARRHGVNEVELLTGQTSHALTRFANNTIHQNVAEVLHAISVRTQEGRRTARATTNRLDAESVRAAVRDSIALLRVTEPDERLLEMAAPQEVQPVDRWSAASAESSPADRAARVAEAIVLAEEAGQTAAGILSAEFGIEAVANSKGLFATHRQTLSTFSMTAMASDGSGWAKQCLVDSAGVDTASLARSAVRKASMSSQPRLIDPGSYTVVLEPAAVLDLIGQIFPDFSATAVEDQRSFLTGRLGEQIFGTNITVFDDVRHPGQSGDPFDGEGVPRQKLVLIDKGVPRDLAYSRSAAHRKGVEPTGHGFPLPNEAGEMPTNIVFAGGDSDLDSMVASTSRGLLVTRLWYIREVDPFQKRMTGMTRDGTFLIENGALVCGIRNMRFNVSLVELLNQVEALGPAVRASGEEMFEMVVPPMKIHDFLFTEVTPAC